MGDQMAEVFVMFPRPVAFVLIFGAVAVAFVALVWKLVGRPIALAWGLVPMTPFDWIVVAWKHERHGRWADALAAYDAGLKVNRWHKETREKRAALLAAHPELTEPPA